MSRFSRQPALRPNHLYRIGVLMGMTANIINERGLADAPRVGVCYRNCAAAGQPVCIPCAVDLAYRQWAASNAAEILELHPALIEDAKECVVTHVIVTGHDDPGYETFEVVEHLQGQGRMFLSLALPAAEAVRELNPDPDGDDDGPLAKVFRIS